MTDKERFDAFMKIVELRTLRASNRQIYEWRVTFGLWALISAATIYLKDRPAPLGLGVLVIFIYAFFWLRAMYVAHFWDNETAKYYIEKATKVLNAEQETEFSNQETRIGWIRWSFGFLTEWGIQFQLLTTVALLYFFYLITNPGVLPYILRPS